MTKEFFAGGKKITLYGSENGNAPVVYLNTVMSEGENIFDACTSLGCPPFVLAAVSNLDWDADMSPWAIPPISKNDTPCSGGADAFLQLLTDQIIPEVNGLIDGKAAYNAIAGYSLAGLFAIYALYKTNAFTKVASASGSLWFPDFCEFAMKNKFAVSPDCIYFSLGDAESKTKNPILQPVETNTRYLEAHYRAKGIKTVYVSNKGNHFQNAVARMADGIKWILEQ